MRYSITPSQRARGLSSNFFGDMDRRIAAARDAGTHVIDLSKGNPDLPTPEHIVAAMQRAVADPANHRYPSYGPRTALAHAIARRYREDHAVDLDPASQVAVFHGSHEALVASVMALVDPGETIVLPDPEYPAYRAIANIAQAHVESLPLRAPDYQPDSARLNLISEARALILNYPNNPTGALARASSFEQAGAAAQRWRGTFVHDFAYSSLGYGTERPLSALTVAPTPTVEISTLSKTYNMAGWRLGYAAGNPDAIAAMRHFQSQAFSTIFGASQDAATAALDGDQTAAAEVVRIYRERRDVVVAGLRAGGWRIHAPEGTFFIWLALPEGTNDVSFAERLLNEHAVAVAPGSGFGPGGAGFIRLGLVHPIGVLDDAVERLNAAHRAMRIEDHACTPAERS